jgi:hypothetical protein
MCGHQPCDSASCTWGEKHRLECEGRLVMRWDRETRLSYYADVKKKRGEAAAQELIREVKNQWDTSKQQPIF